MSEIIVADPLGYLGIQSGRVDTPNREQGANGSSPLDYPQRAAKIGEPVPIVFGRWRDGAGGCFISPGATDCRFENDPVSNDVTASYHFVLSQGVVAPIPVSDVFQRICRVGTHAQAYDRRAASWLPGNFIVGVPGKKTPEASQYCGSIGYYPNMSTLSFVVTVPDGFDSWNRQVHVFIRGGMYVNRLIEGTFGPSDNFADLVQWLLIEGVKFPTLMVDSFRLQIAAEFLEANEFTCNAVISESINYSELINKWAPYFLLTETNNGGEKSLRPLLPINEDGTLNLDEIIPEYTFSEFDILPDTFEVEFFNYADRRPFVAQMTWRQQLEADIGIIRTSEVKYGSTPSNATTESHDLSQFCTRENHAVKAGAYILSKRVRCTHMARFTARPGAHNRLLTPGSIVWVRLVRAASGSALAYHSYLYQVERIGKTLAGEVTYECSHFPVDEEGRSLIALDVASVNGSGILYSITKTGVTCDINDPDDPTIPPPPPPSPPPDQPIPPDDNIPIPPLPDPPKPPNVQGTPPPPPFNPPSNPPEDPPMDDSPDEPGGGVPPGMGGWPEGEWDPAGGNKWTFIATEKVSVLPCESPVPMADDSVVVITVAGEGAWAGNASFTKADFCTNDVNAYDFWLKIYTSDYNYLGNIKQSTVVGYLRTGGLTGVGWSSSRSYSLITRVEPADPDAPGIEDFPPPGDFFDRYGDI